MQGTLENTNSFAQEVTTGARFEMSRMERMTIVAGGLQVLVGITNDGVLQVQVCCMPFFSSRTYFKNVRIRTDSSFADGPRSAGWREHPDQRRRFPFDSRDEERAGYRRPRSGSGSVEEERDSLPEWCLEDAEEETGTFDSSGAFLSLKVRAWEVSS